MFQNQISISHYYLVASLRGLQMSNLLNHVFSEVVGSWQSLD